MFLALLATSLVAGIVPMVAYALILYWFDRYEKEPVGLVLAAFAWGFVPAALFALIAQIILDIPLSIFFVQGDFGYDLVTAGIIAPVTEEIFKGIAVYLIFLLFRNEFDSLFDGVLYGSLVGFGFAAIENILYFVGDGSGFAGLVWLVFFRAFLFGLNHAFFTSLTGMGLAVARLSPGWLVRFVAPWAGLAAAMLAHSIHNAAAVLSAATGFALVLAALADWTGVLFVFVVILASTRRERSWLASQLREEVRLGTLSQAQYDVVTSLARRTQARSATLLRGQFSDWRDLGRYYHACTELAFKKHQKARVGARGAPEEIIAGLRSQVSGMSRLL